MKRKELVAGKRYVNAAGQVFEVVSNDAGYEVRDGKHVHEPKFKQRYMGPEKGHKDYQTNTKIPVLLVRPGKRKEPQAVEPRDLVCEVEKYEEREEQRQVERDKMATEKRAWEKAFKDATGLTGRLEFQYEGEAVMLVTTQTLKRKGIKPGVK